MAVPVPGGITEVKDFANNSEIESLARFAIDEYNKKQNAHLEFEKLVDAKKQMVAGVMYCIKLEATDDGKKQVYETKIFGGRHGNTSRKFRIQACHPYQRRLGPVEGFDGSAPLGE
ncbi:cysteine proteinase inhibitor A-like [Actinidia eriantha]|uniref:cysteine proteinase inhibitor A-like n=1 Tax=Actinidia eriantha TaxID=165200 RepID=UPI00258BA655|nr:cysteine proteinase inhibitor A-like [Actinidia eriantha]